jgi:sulfate permease, SulP family
MQDAIRAGKRRASRITGRDLIAGVTNAVTNIPDAMANAVLAGLNPIQGLYAIMIGTPVASLTTSSQLMTVAVTGAMALIVGDSLSGITAPADKLEALIVLTVLVGATQIVLGLVRAGALVRFVSNAVLQGFLLGVAVNIVLSQVSDLTGFKSDAANKVGKAVDTLLHPGLIDWQIFAIGLFTIAVVLLVERTPAKDFSFLVALVVATVVATLLKWDVPTVRSLGEIPQALPAPTMPSLSLVGSMAVPAISIALVGLIQGAGVSKGTPNRDGTYPDMNRDFIGQGLGNAASGVFGGIPIGGSVSSTAVLVQFGAKSRIANFIVGPIIAVVVLLFSNQVEMIPLTTLAGLLVLVGLRAIKVGAVQTVWQTSVPPRTIMLVTFVAVLLMPVQYAVVLGVAISIVMYVYNSSLDVRVVELKRMPDGSYAEQPVTGTLPDAQVTVLDVYGSVFYAGADIIGGLLPAAAGSHRPAVVLRLRGRTDVGSTFLGVVERYRGEIEQAKGILLLAGVGPELRDQLERTGVLAAIGDHNVCEAQPTLTASVGVAVEAAERWLQEPASRPEEKPGDDTDPGATD